MADNPRIEELKRRVQSDPASIAFAALAEEYRRAGQFDDAINTCKAGLQRHPAYLSAHVTLGRALIEVNRFDEAREELEYVLKIAPENLAAIRALAEIDTRRGEVERPKAPPVTARTALPVAEAARPPARAAVSVPVTPVQPTSVPPAPAPLTPVQPVRAAANVAPAPAPDPALAELDAFLEAIVHARQELENAASDLR